MCLAQVMQMEFVHNAGQLITACTDDSLNLWDFRKANSPELVQSLQLSKEHITTFCLEFQVRDRRSVRRENLNLTDRPPASGLWDSKA